MNWSEQLLFREKIHKQYPELWSLKIVKKRFQILLKCLKGNETILEIGAFNRKLGERIKTHYPNIQYKSMDIDPAYSHDYYSLDEIKELFDVILLFEVIEHLELEKGKELVERIFQLLKPKGMVMLTTPNVYTPGQYWKDISHKTAYHYEELGGLFLSVGFKSIELYRLFNASFLKFFAKAYLFRFLFRFIGIDFTKSVLLIAKKS